MVRLLWLAAGLFGPVILTWFWNNIWEVPSYVEDVKEKQELDSVREEEELKSLRDFIHGKTASFSMSKLELYNKLTQEEKVLFDLRLKGILNPHKS
jgi:hypothetical protein